MHALRSRANVCLRKRSWHLQCTRAHSTSLRGALDYQEQANQRLHRFYVQHSLLSSPPHGYLALEQDEGRHAIKALRLAEGSHVELCDGRGCTLPAIVTTVEKSASRALLEPLGPPVTHPWLGPRIVLAVACTTLKGGRADWLVEKACELGAAEFVPLVTARSQPTASGNKYKPASAGKSKLGNSESSSDYVPGRLERVAIAATKQSLRTHGMLLHPPCSLGSFLAQLHDDQDASTTPLSLIAAAGAPPLKHILAEHVAARSPSTPHTSSVVAASGGSSGSASLSGLHSSGSDPQEVQQAESAGQPEEHPAASLEQQQQQTEQGQRMPRADFVLLVGPEGDWTQAELEQVAGSGGGAVPVGLGSLRLRTETAAISLLAAVNNMLA